MYHNKVTKSTHRYEYGERLSKTEFREMYRNAKLAPMSKEHPISSIIKAQKFSDNKKFYKQYMKMEKLKKVDSRMRNESFRKNLFSDFVDELRAQGLSQEDARAEAMEYYGY